MRKICMSAIISMIVLSLSFVVASAQQNMSFTPQNGPIGTTVFINCGPSGTVATFASQEILLDTNGFGSFEIPTAYAPGGYEIGCQTFTNVSTSIGAFNLTECPLLNERTLRGNTSQTLSVFSAQGGGNSGNLTGENISVVGSDSYSYIVDLDNANGAQLRLIVSSNDPTRLVNYINNLNTSFQVYSGRPSEDLSNCNTDVLMPFGITPATTVEDGAVDIEFVLLSGGSILPDRNYLVFFAVSSALEPQLTHTYHPENASAIAGRFANYQGFMSLSAWDNSNTTAYIDSVDTYNPNLPVPGLVAQAPSGAEYYLGVRNLISNNASYTLSGTFQTIPCNTFDNSCLGTQPEAQSVVLARGTGITSGSPVYNGNFEVEAYCQQVLPSSNVSHDDVDWYCSNDQGVRVRLTENDFTSICRQTYAIPNAFAVRDLDLTTPDDSQNNIPAFNWRCLGPDTTRR